MHWCARLGRSYFCGMAWIKDTGLSFILHKRHISVRVTPRQPVRMKAAVPCVLLRYIFPDSAITLARICAADHLSGIRLPVKFSPSIGESACYTIRAYREMFGFSLYKLSAVTLCALILSLPRSYKIVETRELRSFVIKRHGCWKPRGVKICKF